MAEQYLVHHGRLGQRWGRRNGPPWPLDRGTVSSVYGSGAKKYESNITVKRAVERRDKKELGRISNRITDASLDYDGYRKLTREDGPRVIRKNLSKKQTDRLIKKTVDERRKNAKKEFDDWAKGGHSAPPERTKTEKIEDKIAKKAIKTARSLSKAKKELPSGQPFDIDLNTFKKVTSYEYRKKYEKKYTKHLLKELNYKDTAAAKIFAKQFFDYELDAIYTNLYEEGRLYDIV